MAWGKKEATSTATAAVVLVVTRNQKSTHTHTPVTGIRSTFNSSCLDLSRDVITRHVIQFVKFRTPARLESGNK